MRLAVILSVPLFFLFCRCGFSGDLETALESLERTYKNADSWQADFSQSTFVELLRRHVKKRGEIFLKKPGKLRIVYKGEREKIYVSNGKSLWIYTEGDSQAEFFKNASSILAREALSFLCGLGDVKKDFRARFSGRGAGMEFVELTPKSTKSSIEKIVLGIEAKSGLVAEATIFNVTGNRTHYVFEKIRINTGLDDGLFEFKKAVGVNEISE